jgi:hypothetical protein
MSPQHHKTYRQSGASLVAVLWLIGFLGLAILGAAKFVTLDTSWATKVKKRAEAKNLAETGLALGTHPRVKSGDPLLRSFDPETETGYEVRITSEEGLIPLNQVLLSGRKDCLKRLFEIWGQDPDEAASLVDAMRDWIDADGLASLNGAESPAYDAAGRPGFPFNRPFASLGEVDLVIGMERLAALKPEWKDYFTLWSMGQIDLNEASAEIVYAAIGAGDLTRAEEFVLLRDGADGASGTLDDQKFPSVQSVVAFFGAQADPSNTLLTARSATRRVYSKGIYRGEAVGISETRRSNLLLWRREQ